MTPSLKSYTGKCKLSSIHIHSRIIIDGNAIYEVDEECLRKKKEKEQEEEHEKQQEKRKNKT